jgi:hypothetical protein
MFSEEYYDSVAQCADFHKKNKTWSVRPSVIFFTRII